MFCCYRCCVMLSIIIVFQMWAILIIVILVIIIIIVGEYVSQNFLNLAKGINLQPFCLSQNSVFVLLCCMWFSSGFKLCRLALHIILFDCKCTVLAIHCPKRNWRLLIIFSENPIRIFVATSHNTTLAFARKSININAV